MRFIPLLFVLVFLFFKTSNAQNAGYKHPTIIGVQFGVHDFQHMSSLGKGNGWDAAGGIYLMSGLSSRWDWGFDINGSFPGRALKVPQVQEEKNLQVQGSAFLRSRLFDKEQLLQPYLFSGVGVTAYNGLATGFIPMGTGIQVRIKDVFLSLNVQYRIPLDQRFNRSFYYSLTLSGLVSESRRKKHGSTIGGNLAVGATDRDGDGIVDAIDACPDRPGIVSFKGCPDSDGDGIEDPRDQCPYLAGVAKYQGCPIPDSDMDGINDEEDSCATVPGFLRYEGCPIPDRDGDGVNDEDDQCVDVFGLKKHNGCPETKSNIQQHLGNLAKHIFFETGKATLLKKSLPVLDSVAAIMNEHILIRILIEGHTDNVGTNSSNQILSEKRARAVANYLISVGIESKRIQFAGFGSLKPLGDNNTIEGRYFNRRVELKILE